MVILYRSQFFLVYYFSKIPNVYSSIYWRLFIFNESNLRSIKFIFLSLSLFPLFTRYARSLIRSDNIILLHSIFAYNLSELTGHSKDLLIYYVWLFQTNYLFKFFMNSEMNNPTKWLQANISVSSKQIDEIKSQKIDIEMNNCILGEGVLQGLVKRNIRSLQLYNCSLDQSTLIILPKLTCIISLNLSWNNIGPQGALYIGKLQDLIQLRLQSSFLGNIGAKHISSLRKLTCLKVQNNEIGVEGAYYISKIQTLVQLDMGGNPVGDEGIHYLCEISQICRLSIWGCNIGDQATFSVRKLKKLIELNLQHNNVTNFGCNKICSLQLNFCYFDPNCLTSQAVKQAKKRIINKFK